jgi:predicted DNA-binding protein (MmcQ/YjbR family)
MSPKELDDYLLSFPNAWIDFPFGEEVSVYKIGHAENGGGKMFAVVNYDDKPFKVSLKCDPQLAERLRNTYETVLPGYQLSKKHWNTILMTGQVPDDEFRSLVQLSYRLVDEAK